MKARIVRSLMSVFLCWQEELDDDQNNQKIANNRCPDDYTISQSPNDAPRNHILPWPPPLIVAAEDLDGFGPAVVDVGASVVKSDIADPLGVPKLDRCYSK